jgi:hypothetical protein
VVTNRLRWCWVIVTIPRESLVRAASTVLPIVTRNTLGGRRCESSVRLHDICMERRYQATAISHRAAKPIRRLAELHATASSEKRGQPRPEPSANGFFVPRNCNRIGVPGKLNVSLKLFTR